MSMSGYTAAFVAEREAICAYLDARGQRWLADRIRNGEHLRPHAAASVPAPCPGPAEGRSPGVYHRNVPIDHGRGNWPFKPGEIQAEHQGPFVGRYVKDEASGNWYRPVRPGYLGHAPTGSTAPAPRPRGMEEPRDWEDGA